MKKIILIGIMILLASFAYSQIEIEPKPEPKPIPVTDSYKTFSPTISEKKIIQTEVDENYPCYPISYNQIECKAIDETTKDKIYDDLNVIDKTKFLINDGIPITNVEGDTVKEEYLDWSKDNIITIDITKEGTIKIGYESNIFEITDLTYGTFNQTTETGDNVYLSTSYLEGDYFLPIYFNQSYNFVNLTFASNQPTGSDVYIQLKTFNTTYSNNEFYKDNSLVGYWKMDSNLYLDYSGYNNTGTGYSMLTHSPSGKFDGSARFDAANNRRIYVDDVPEHDLDGRNYSVSGWIYMTSWGEGNYGRIIEKSSACGGTGSGNGFGLMAASSYYTTNSLSLFHYGANDFLAQASSNKLSLNTWIHFVVSFDSVNDQAYFYFNGNFDRSDTINDILPTNNAIEIGIRSCDYNREFGGYIDEIAIWNRTLTTDEVSELYGSNVRNWTPLSTEYYETPSQVTTTNGDILGIKTTISRTNTGLSPYLDSINIGHMHLGEGIAETPDNAPTVTLNAPSNAWLYSVNNISLNCTATDDFNLTNVTLWTNYTGVWTNNETRILDGTDNDYFADFSINLSDTTIAWNCQAFDNKSQEDWANANWTVTVDVECVDSDCAPYVCNAETDACYTSCTSHTHCNSSAYCGYTGTCIYPKENDGDVCKNIEYFGLTDDNVCIGGYCFDDTIGSTNEYCTDDSTGCVDDGTEYAEDYKKCVAPNDFYQCLGGESEWSSITDCRDTGDAYDISATVSGHIYCGYYNAETCDSTNGCVPAIPFPTTDCGYYYYNGASCGTTTADCDVGCGAPYDLETCTSPNVLSSDCITCTAPEVDNPPTVTLIAPTNGSTRNTLTINHQYDVDEDNTLLNCTLWTNITGNWLPNASDTNPSKITTNTLTVTYNTNATVLWNVECWDNASQNSTASNNWTFNILTVTVEEAFFAVAGANEDDILFEVNAQNNLVNVTVDTYFEGDLYVRGGYYSFSPIKVPQINVTEYMDIDESGTHGVRFTNPYNEYLKIQGNSFGADLTIGLYDWQGNPFISSDRGKNIRFGITINASKSLSVEDKLYLNGSYINDWSEINYTNLGGNSNETLWQMFANITQIMNNQTIFNLINSITTNGTTYYLMNNATINNMIGVAIQPTNKTIMNNQTIYNMINAVSDNDTDTTYTAGVGIALTGTTFSATATNDTYYVPNNQTIANAVLNTTIARINQIMNNATINNMIGSAIQPTNKTIMNNQTIYNMINAVSDNDTIGNSNETLWSMFMNITGGTFTGGINGSDAAFSGNVGIGTTIPDSTLNVAGSVNLSNNPLSFTIGSGSSGVFTFYDAQDTSEYPQFECYDGNGESLCEFASGIYVTGGHTYLSQHLRARSIITNDAANNHLWMEDNVSVHGIINLTGNSAQSETGINSSIRGFMDTSTGVYGYANDLVAYGGIFAGETALGTSYGTYSSAYGGTLNYGTYSSATGSFASNYGLYGTASGGFTNYGVYASGTNWAGYFASGDVYSADDLLVGATSETIYDSGFSLGGDDLFVADDLGVEDDAWIEGGLCVYGGTCPALGDGDIWAGDVITVSGTGKVCGSRFVTVIYQGHAYSDTGDEFATTMTDLDTEGKTYTCLDCIDDSGAADTCSTDDNSWNSCEYKVTC